MKKSRLLLIPMAVAALLAGCDSIGDADPSTGSSLTETSGVLRVLRPGEMANSAKVGVFASTVVSSLQGQAHPSGAIAPERSNPDAALGAPDAAFFSLGFDVPTTSVSEGEIILGFGTGQALKTLLLTISEETYGSSAARESADVYVSEQPDGEWIYVGTAHNDGSTTNTRSSEINLADQCIRYVRLVDRTDRAQYGSRKRGDGFDVNAVKVESDGTCAAPSIVSGSIFVDADEDAVRDGIESGVQDVAVHLVDAASTVYTATTEPDGSFTFEVPAGSYTLLVPTAAPASFNAQLYQSYTYTGGTTAQVPVVAGPSTPPVDFGFAAQVASMTQELESGVITTNTEDVAFWTRQFRHAVLHDQTSVEVTAGQLAQYMTQIEALLLPQPFQFGSRDRHRVALAILSLQSQTGAEAFVRELLAAELNVVSGRGSGSEAFDMALLGYGESVAISLITVSSGKGTAASLEEATRLLRAYNSSGGGGGVGGPK